MELQEYAQTILWGTSLEEKLVVPTKLLDSQTAVPLTSMECPGRPRGLEMEPPGGKRAKFPAIGALEDPKARGRALHFFANHELLALELMALALLKFPSADSRWRRTIFATMRDEQKHLKLYLKRMKELGVEWGEIPLNRFFWDHISSINSPEDFAIRMSLTFEQANLDFSLVYRDAFRDVGDAVSADVMHHVLEDEIRHVRHGVEAIQASKPADRSLWEVYAEGLPYPLTPARAKGRVFFAEPRRRAGLSEDFIDALRVYRHTRGRPPVVRLFNPATEAALGQGIPGHRPNRGILAMAKDLEVLPALLGNTDDVVLVRKKPSIAHQARMLEWGWPQAEWVEVPLDRHRFPREHSLTQRQFSGMEPWGWDPTVAAFLEPLQSGWKDHAEPLSTKAERYRNWSNKAWLAERLPEVLSPLRPEVRAKMIDRSPSVGKSLRAVRDAVQEHWEVGTGRVVLKAPFGTAGRDAIRVEQSELKPPEIAWVERTLATQGSVVVEAWYTRVMDVSFQFRVHADGRFQGLGLTPFETDERGQYRGSWVAPLGLRADPEQKAFLYRGKGGSWVQAALETLSQHLASHLAKQGFRGRAGVDAMVVRLPCGALKLRAPLELNPRATMGHVALAAAKPFLGGGRIAFWTLITPPLVRAAGCTHPRDVVDLWEKRLPRKFLGGQWLQGIFPVNEVEKAKTAVGVLAVGPSRDCLLKSLKID